MVRTVFEFSLRQEGLYSVLSSSELPGFVSVILACSSSVFSFEWSFTSEKVVLNSFLSVSFYRTEVV